MEFPALTCLVVQCFLFYPYEMPTQFNHVLIVMTLRSERAARMPVQGSEMNALCRSVYEWTWNQADVCVVTTCAAS